MKSGQEIPDLLQQAHEETTLSSMFVNAEADMASSKTSEPISSALTKKVDECVYELVQILDKCDISVDTISQFDREALPRSKLYEKLNVVSPVQIFKLLLDVRLQYEVYLHVFGTQMMRKRVMYPQLCEAIAAGQIFRTRADYPLLESWYYTNPTVKTIKNKGYFMTPQELAFWSLTNEEQQQFQLQKPVVSQSAHVQEVLNAQHFDPGRLAGLIRNTHPLQNLASFFYKYPECIILLGQKCPSITKRIALYVGYIQQFERQFIGSTYDQQIRSVKFGKQSSEDVLPLQSLVLTPFSRAILAATLKSLITHPSEFALWPLTYYYQPRANTARDCFFSDFLLAVASSECLVAWVKSALGDTIQQLYQEKFTNLFQMLTDNKSKEEVHRSITPLLKVMTRQITSKVEQLPDIARTVLTVVKFGIENLVLNVTEKLFARNDSQLTKALSVKFHELQELVDYRSHELTMTRARQYTKRLFQQFYTVFIVGIVCRTAMNNPANFELILPSQSDLIGGDVFFSNLSVLGDLLYEVLASGAQSPFEFQLEERYESKMTDQAQSVLTPDKIKQLRVNIAMLTQKFDEGQRNVYQQAAERSVYQLDKQMVRQLIQTSEHHVSNYGLTTGFWQSSASYFYVLAESFRKNTQYLKTNLSVLQKNCDDVLQQVFENEDETRSEHMFAVDVSFSLFSTAAENLAKLEVVFTDEKLSSFVAMIKNEQCVLNSVVFVPYFDNIFQEQKEFEATQTHSLTVDLLHQTHRQALQELDTFSSLVRDSDQKFLVQTNQPSSLQTELANANVSDEIKQFYSHCDQIIALFDLMRKINEFKAQINKLETKNEEQYFQQISLFQQSLNQLQAETEQTILNIQHHTDDIQLRKEERGVLEQLLKILTAKAEQLAAETDDEQDIQRSTNNDEQQMKNFNLYEELEKEYQLQRQQQILEELVFSYQMQVKNLQNLQREHLFTPSSTLERLMGRPVPRKAVRSYTYLRMFQNEELPKADEPDDSNDRRMKELDDALADVQVADKEFQFEQPGTDAFLVRSDGLRPEADQQAERQGENVDQSVKTDEERKLFV